MVDKSAVNISASSDGNNYEWASTAPNPSDIYLYPQISVEFR